MIEPEKRIEALQALFPVGEHPWYQGKRIEHVARAVLASLAVDVGVGRGIEAHAADGHVALLARYLDVLGEAEAAASLADEIRAFLAAPAAPDRQAARDLIARIIRAASFGALADAALTALHIEALAVEDRANTNFRDAYRAALQLDETAPPTPPGSEPVPLAPADLEAVIRRHIAGEDALRVDRLTPLVGGLSKQTILAETTGGIAIPARIVVRRDVGIDWAGNDVAQEYATLTTLHEGGVRVPRPLLVHRPADGGHGYMVVEWNEGEPFGLTPAIRSRALCRQMAEQLALTHVIPLDRLAHVPGHDRSTTAQVLLDIDQRERSWDRLAQRDPLAEYGLRWLRRHVGVTEGLRAMVHGDYCPHNILRRDETIVAVLDWEFARITHPAEDLGYARTAAEALWSWEEFLDAYVAAGGEAPDAAVLNYFEVMACLMRIGIMGEMEARFVAAPTATPLSIAGSLLQTRQDALCRLHRCLAMPMPT